MFLTVAIPLYNEAKRLPVMLKSLEEQDWSLFEVRFSDDGSTDNSREVVEAFAARHPGRVFYSWHENEGQALCRNRMIPEAAGDYIWFCDGDDAIVSGAIAAIYRCIKGTGCDILAFLDWMPTERVQKLVSDPVELNGTEAVLAVRGATWSRIFRTAFMRENNLGFPRVKYLEDTLLGYRAACFSKKTLFWYELPYIYYRRKGSATGIMHARYIREALESAKCFDDIAAEFPERAFEIGFQKLSICNYLYERLDTEASRELQDECLPLVWKDITAIIGRNDNPILNLPYALISRYRRALAGKQATEDMEIALRKSLSWRITAPLRAIGRLFEKRK